MLATSKWWLHKSSVNVNKSCALVLRPWAIKVICKGDLSKTNLKCFKKCWNCEKKVIRCKRQFELFVLFIEVINEYLQPNEAKSMQFCSEKLQLQLFERSSACCITFRVAVFRLHGTRFETFSLAWLYQICFIDLLSELFYTVCRSFSRDGSVSNLFSIIVSVVLVVVVLARVVVAVLLLVLIVVGGGGRLGAGDQLERLGDGLWNWRRRRDVVAFGAESVFIGDVADLNELTVRCGVAVASLFIRISWIYS